MVVLFAYLNIYDVFQTKSTQLALHSPPTFPPECHHPVWFISRSVTMWPLSGNISSELYMLQDLNEGYIKDKGE